jgi:hypothetical protein
MALTADTTYRTKIALADKAAGEDLVAAVEAGQAVAAQTASTVAAAIVATATSTTTDFATLKVGDLVCQIPATAGNAQKLVVATAGTLPEAAVVGDLYIVLRSL